MSRESLHRLLRLLISSAAFARMQIGRARRGWPVTGPRGLRLHADAGAALSRVDQLLRLSETLMLLQQRHAPARERRQKMGELIDRPLLFVRSDDIATTPLLDWPSLDQLRLGDGDVLARREGIGGSDANVILSGDRDKILGLWREKRGEQPAPDLSTNLAVMLGCWTEAFNRHWFEKFSGEHVDQLHVRLSCPTNAWRRCTLDGYLSQSNAVWEAKHTSAFTKPDDVLERYMPQLQHNMAVARCETAVLSVIFGNSKFETFAVASDWMYQIELLNAEVDFWDCVQTGREPVPALAPAPPRPIGVREVCLDGNNSWAAAAADWLQHREAAKRHASACSQLKELVEPDVGRAFGHGVEAKRSKAGAITIRELGQ